MPPCRWVERTRRAAVSLGRTSPRQGRRVAGRRHVKEPTNRAAKQNVPAMGDCRAATNKS
jgi:hypothetical protein